MNFSTFWRITEDARIEDQAREAQQKIAEQSLHARDEISMKIGWMIRSDAQKRRYAKQQEIQK